MATIGLAAPGAADGAAIRPGLWKFETRLERAAPVLATAPLGPQRIAPQTVVSDNPTARYTICVDPVRPLPAEFGPQCKLDGVERRGARFSWSMTCTNSAGTVRSDGVAQYHGNAMEATMVSHLPARNGAAVNATQHITGTYLGPCRQRADLPLTPSHLNPSASTTTPPTDTVEPAAAAVAPQSPVAADNAAAGAPPQEPHRRRHARRHFRHYRYHYRYYGAALGSGPYNGYGPGP